MKSGIDSRKSKESDGPVVLSPPPIAIESGMSVPPQLWPKTVLEGEDEMDARMDGS